jgi:hypothetical protein
MKLKLTKRDILFFILGFMTLFAIEAAYDWDNHVKAFKKGYNDARAEFADSPQDEKE